MIEINNLTRIPVNKEFVKKLAKKVLEKEKKRNRELSIALIGPSEIKKINKKYRKRNRVTDVLSFNHNQKFLKNIFESGEIVICPKTVKTNAKKFHQSFKKELAKILIHGLLHLLGYSHKSKIRTEKMEEKENYYLNLVF